MTASETFQYLADLWNSEFAKGSNRVYKKYPEHLSMYYKKWAKNQARDTAVKEANVDKLLEGVEYTPVANAIAGPRSLVALNVRNGDTEEEAELRENGGGLEENELERDAGEDGDAGRNGINNGTAQLLPDATPAPTIVLVPPPTPTIPLAATRAILHPPQYPHCAQLQPHAGQNALRMPTPSSTLSRKRTRNCKTAGCKDTSDCPGKSNRNNCIWLTGGMNTERTQGQRSCQQCIGAGKDTVAAQACPGRWVKSRCALRNNP